MLHKIRHAVGEFDARELLSGDVKVNCDQYGTPPSRRPSLDRHASAVVAGCTVTELGDLAQVKIRLVPHKQGNRERANRHDLAAFINRDVDVRTSTVQSFPLAFRLYRPLRKLVQEAWESLTCTYVALGQKHLQAYLNEFTVRRRLRSLGAIATMRQELLRICVTTPTISYRQLVKRQFHLPLATAA